MKLAFKIITAAALIIIIAASIFFFSDQSGADSHSLSITASEKIAHNWVDHYYKDRYGLSGEALAPYLESPLRKIAHLLIYTALGLGTVIAMDIIFDRKLRFLHILICILIVFGVGVADEINQYYSGGRGASIRDVLLDTLGGCFGIYLRFIVCDFFRHLVAGIRRASSKS